jgi:hypothetical protein
MSNVFIGGIYTLRDIKYDLLKIIEPYDGEMYNEKETEKVTSLFTAFLSDLQKAYKLREFDIEVTDKTNAVTFDLTIRIHRDRSPKKLKIHVGRMVHFRDRVAA